MPNLKETTQVRLIQSEARSAILKEREAILGGVKSMVDDLRREMKEHFPTKVDFLEWQLRTNKELDELIRAHVVKDHRVALSPPPRVSLIPRGRLSGKQKAALWGAVAAVLTGVAALIQKFLSP